MDGEQSREFKSGLLLGHMTPRGNYLLIFVFNETPYIIDDLGFSINVFKLTALCLVLGTCETV